ncbi:phage head-tail joining protein [Phenylobacterium sp.]|uniref:phage head-tail joining protein n=1 Tax=Phenylobacterium sp. TaxID=1871053 RepID=UPI0027377681|nr:hypothetical protein [Phenylobacterium sp.]MDP3853161.1 hypothetical protein [Phenylobacterium sp.]
MPAPDYATEISGLVNALASGELTIEQNGERVTYRSVKEIRSALDHFRDLAASASTSGQGQFGFSAPAHSRD